MHAGCYQDCDGATESGIELFVGCVTNDICDVECAINIQPATPPTPQEECTASCERLGFFQCITGTDVAACTTTCDSASKDAVDSFIACNEGICDDNSCLVTLQSSL